MFFLVTSLLVIMSISIMFSPFPYWKTYLLLWKTIFFVKPQGITFKAKTKQASFLLKYLFLCPVFTVFWYIDEIFFPEYKKNQVSPVFIVGQPRCGTTFLHRTLANDSPTFLAIKHIEWRYPFISLQLLFNKLKITQKISSRNYWPKNAVGEIAAKMHPNLLSDWEEDGIFFEECFLHHFFIFLRFPYPVLLSQLDSFDSLPEKVQIRLLDMHQIVVKKMMYLHGNKAKYYLSKEVTSHEKIPHLLKLYPSAKVIVCVRKSKGFMNSLLPLVKYSTQSKNQVDPTTINGWDDCILSRMRSDSKLLITLCNDIIPSGMQTRITFNYLMGNLVECILRIYKELNLEVRPDYLDFLKRSVSRQELRCKGYNNDMNTISGFEEYDDFVDSIEKNISSLIMKN